MSDALSLVEIDGLYVELLPARTVLSMFSVGGPRGGDAGNGGTGGTSGAAGAGSGTVQIYNPSIYLEQGSTLSDTITGGEGGATSAPGGAATGGAGAAGS